MPLMGRFRTVFPSSPEEVRQYLKPAKGQIYDEREGPSVKISGGAFPDRDHPAYAIGSRKQWFWTNRAMRGSAERVRRNVGGAVLQGALEDERFVQFAIHSESSKEKRWLYYPVSWSLETSQRMAGDPLLVAAEGLFMYLEGGIDPDYSRDLEKRVTQAFETQLDSNYRSTMAAVYQGPWPVEVAG